MLKFIASALLNQAAEGSCLGAQLSPCPHGMHFLFGIKCCFNPSPLVDTGSQSHDGPWGKKMPVLALLKLTLFGLSFLLVRMSIIQPR